MKWWEQEELIETILDDGMELLAFHQRAEWNGLDRFGVQKNIMITLSTALIAAGAAAVAAERKAARGSSDAIRRHPLFAASYEVVAPFSA